MRGALFSEGSVTLHIDPNLDELQSFDIYYTPGTRLASFKLKWYTEPDGFSREPPAPRLAASRSPAAAAGASASSAPAGPAAWGAVLPLLRAIA